jgi:hypothetical protein
MSGGGSRQVEQSKNSPSSKSRFMIWYFSSAARFFDSKPEKPLQGGDSSTASGISGQKPRSSAG